MPLQALIVNQFGGLAFGSSILAVNSVIIRSVGANIAVLIGWGFLFRVLAYIFLAGSFFLARKMM